MQTEIEQMEKIESTFRALIAQADVTASHYQQDIFRAVLRGGRYIVAAVPGSGKTWTIVQSLRFVRSGASVLMTAFNKDAGDRLNVRANDFVRSLVAQHAAAGDTTYAPPFVDARNIHRVGTETLLANGISFKKNGSKYYKIVDAFLRDHDIQPKTMETFKSQAVKLFEKVRLTLSDENDAEVLYHLCLKFDCAIDRYEGGDDFFVEEEQEETAEWKLLVELIPYMIAEGIRQARREGVVDFTDMIWMPVRLKMKMYRTFDYLFLDEGQDFNACQRELLLACAKTLSTIFVFGDRNQAIYSWAGASENSLDEMKDFLGAEELPLSICYRCDKSIVRKAADVFYGIESADTANEGHVEYIDRESVAMRAQAGYWILGRWTKDLVALCLEMLLSGKRANVKGKDQGAQVKTQLENLKKFNKNFKADTFLALPQFAGDYKRRLSDDFEKVEDKEEKQEKFDRTMDQIETMLLLFDAYKACWNADNELDEGAAFAKFLQPAIRDKRTGKLVGYGAFPLYPSLENFQAMIDNFFAEDKPGDEKEQIVLMTIHRSKGGENEVVVILDYDVLPSKKPTKRTKSIKEEMNLEYVAVSRAQKTLYLAVNILAVPANPIYTGLQPNENEISNTEYLERQAEQMRKMTTTIVDAEVVEIAPVAAIAAADSVLALPAPAPVPATTTEKKKGGRKASGKADEKGRIRQKWQGTFDPKTLQFLSALVENGDIADKSRFVEQLIQATDLFQAWSAAQEEDETPNPDDDGGNGGGAPAPSAQDSVEEEEAATDAAVPPAAALDMIEARHRYMPETVAADEEESNVAGTILRSWADALLQDERQADEIAPMQVALIAPDENEEESQTVRFFFHCKSYSNGKQCSHRWTRDYTVDAAGVPFRMEDGTRITLADDARKCPACDKQYVSYKPIKARHSTSHQCNDICRFATGPKCTCSCGGKHHGEGHVVGATLFAGTTQTDFVSFEHLRTEI